MEEQLGSFSTDVTPKPQESLLYLSPGPGPFCQVRRCCPAPSALHPGPTHTSTRHEEISSAVFFPNAVLSPPSSPRQTLCLKYRTKATRENNEIHETVTDKTKMQH